MKPYPQADDADPQKFYDCLLNGTRVLYECPPELPLWDDLKKKCNTEDNIINRGLYRMQWFLHEMPILCPVP